MKPLQVWLPALDPTLSLAGSQRDLRRALEKWDDVTSVWLLPWLKKEELFQNPFAPWAKDLALPSETLNRIDIYHVTKEGFIYGAFPKEHFPERSIGRLLDDWLSVGAGKESAVLQYPMPREIPFIVPVFDDEKNELRHKRVKLTPESPGALAVDHESLKESLAQRKVGFRWPPKDSGLPSSVVPSAESLEYYGPMKRETMLVDGIELPTLVSSRHPSVRSLHVLDVWPGRLRKLFPYGSNHDAYKAVKDMQRIAERSKENPAGALDEARRLATGSIGDGQTTLLSSWFYPTFMQCRADGLLMELEGKYDKNFKTLEEACASEFLKTKLREPVPVRQTHGVLGLFWALLIEQLEDGRRFRRCERCGCMISGRKNKKFCGQSDDPDCWKNRRAADKRRERARTKRSKR